MSNILIRISNLILKVNRKYFTPISSLAAQQPSPQSIRVVPWFKDNGDKTHRLNYDLDENSVVFDLGGYEGQWASDIFSKYLSKVHVFEPYDDYAHNIRERFARNNKIKVHRFGLARESAISKLSISADASSLYKEGDDFTEVEMVEASQFLAEYNITRIDLMKINIEGGEYELLDHLIEIGAVNKIHNIQVQFHDFVENAENRMRSIQSRLRSTHYLTYQYEFVWENWALKK